MVHQNVSLSTVQNKKDDQIDGQFIFTEDIKTSTERNW
jgi:hypothetical protein